MIELIATMKAAGRVWKIVKRDHRYAVQDDNGVVSGMWKTSYEAEAWIKRIAASKVYTLNPRQK